MFISLLVKYSCFKGILHIFLEIGSFYNPPRVKQLSFYCFRIHSADFLIFTTISVTRQFLVSLTSILGKKIHVYTMEVNETRNSLVIYILLNIRKSAEWIRCGWIRMDPNV